MLPGFGWFNPMREFHLVKTAFQRNAVSKNLDNQDNLLTKTETLQEFVFFTQSKVNVSRLHSDYQQFCNIDSSRVFGNMCTPSNWLFGTGESRDVKKLAGVFAWLRLKPNHPTQGRVVVQSQSAGKISFAGRLWYCR
jgi:hypothetical protein